MRFVELSEAELEALTRPGKVLESEGSVPVVWRRGNEIIKRFRRHKWLSSDLIRPYAQRFADNAAQLLSLGISAPVVTAGYRLHKGGDRILIYQMLEGESVSELDPPISADALASVYARLHAAGVLFRSIHLSNILLRADGDFGLIDVTDVQFRGRPLTNAERADNLGYAWAHPRDATYFTPDRSRSVAAAYVTIAKLDEEEGAVFMARLEAAIQRGRKRRERRRRRKQK